MTERTMIERVAGYKPETDENGERFPSTIGDGPITNITIFNGCMVAVTRGGIVYVRTEAGWEKLACWEKQA